MGVGVGDGRGVGVGVGVGRGVGVGVGEGLGVGVGVGVGVDVPARALTAAAALMRPRLTNEPTGTAVVSSAFSTCTRVALGKRLRIRAAAPATDGVANDVPHQVVQIAPGLPVSAQPGAATRTHDP